MENICKIKVEAHKWMLQFFSETFCKISRGKLSCTYIKFAFLFHRVWSLLEKAANYHR